jgi:NitT/TauT family transport system ATP-binding protein
MAPLGLMLAVLSLVSHDLAEAIALADRVIVMSARPGRIVADLRIEIARPRSVRALQKMRAYHDLYAQLWNELERASPLGMRGGGMESAE